jgi:hypothetical protein
MVVDLSRVNPPRLVGDYPRLERLATFGLTRFSSRGSDGVA